MVDGKINEVDIVDEAEGLVNKIHLRTAITYNRVKEALRQYQALFTDVGVSVHAKNITPEEMSQANLPMNERILYWDSILK